MTTGQRSVPTNLPARWTNLRRCSITCRWNTRQQQGYCGGDIGGTQYGCGDEGSVCKTCGWTSLQHTIILGSLNCDKRRLAHRHLRTSREPQVHYGLIASGNQVIKHGKTRDWLAKEYGMLYFEMEAAESTTMFGHSRNLWLLWFT